MQKHNNMFSFVYIVLYIQAQIKLRGSPIYTFFKFPIYTRKPHLISQSGKTVIQNPFIKIAIFSTNQTTTDHKPKNCIISAKITGTINLKQSGIFFNIFFLHFPYVIRGHLSQIYIGNISTFFIDKSTGDRMYLCSLSHGRQTVYSFSYNSFLVNVFSFLNIPLTLFCLTTLTTNCVHGNEEVIRTSAHRRIPQSSGRKLRNKWKH